MDYNGWANRSTWLVQLHLTNTNKEVAEAYTNAAVSADTEILFKRQVTTLIPDTKLMTEEKFNFHEINWTELWDANRITA